MLLRKDFIAHVPARSHLSGIRLKHEGCATLNHTVDKHLQMRGAHHIALKARAHRRRFRRNPLNRVCAFEVKRHFTAAQEPPLGLKLAQQLGLIDISVHQMKPRDALLRAMYQPLGDHILVHLTLGFAWGWHRVFACGQPHHFSPPVPRQRKHWAIGSRLKKLAARQAILAHHDQ